MELTFPGCVTLRTSLESNSAPQCALGQAGTTRAPPPRAVTRITRAAIYVAPQTGLAHSQSRTRASPSGVSVSVLAWSVLTSWPDPLRVHTARSTSPGTHFLAPRPSCPPGPARSWASRSCVRDPNPGLLRHTGCSGPGASRTVGPQDPGVEENGTALLPSQASFS